MEGIKLAPISPQLLSKLLKVQTEIKVNKTHFNEFGNYFYRNSEDILQAIKPLANEVGAVVILSDKPIVVGQYNYIEATASFIDIDSGESISVTASARETDAKKKMDASQLSGACSSYARKYALNGLLDLDDNKDPDFPNGNQNQNQNYNQYQDNYQNQNYGQQNQPAYMQEPDYQMQDTPQYLHMPPVNGFIPNPALLERRAELEKELINVGVDLSNPKFIEHIRKTCSIFDIKLIDNSGLEALCREFENIINKKLAKMQEGLL